MFIPVWLLVTLALLAITVFGWTVQVVLGRNPFPFPDPGSRGFSARVVLDVEPGLPIAFVVTDAFPGTVINFRKHMIHLPRPQPAPRWAKSGAGPCPVPAPPPHASLTC